MDKREFLDELNRLCDEFGADVYVNMKNSKGSPMPSCKSSKLKEIVLNTCQIASVKIIPRQVEEEKEDGEAAIHSDSGEIG